MVRYTIKALFVSLLLCAAQAQAEVVVQVRGAPSPVDPSYCQLEFTAQNKDPVFRTVNITGFTALDAQGKALPVNNTVVNIGTIQPLSSKKSTLPNEVTGACASVHLEMQNFFCIPEAGCEIRWQAEGIARVRVQEKAK